jgi:hypothetical protein
LLEQINIKEKVKAKLTLQTMSYVYQQGGTGGPQGYSTAMVGQAYPYVLLNNMEVPSSLLNRLEIDCIGFMPKIFMTMSVMKGKVDFFKKTFPRAGDIISVFIRSPNDNIKPIRNDYQVVTVDYIGSNYHGDIGESFLRMTGRLYIPNMYNERSFLYEGSSFDVLKNVAEELQIGFASNVDSTNDSMKWMAMGNYETLINNVTKHAWNDEKSFFTSFIDFYYNLNLIDVNKQFTYAPDGQPGVISDINVRVPSKEQTFEKELNVFSLTNDIKLMSFNNFISKFNIINNASLITYKEGVQKDFSMYDFPSKTLVLDTISPLSTADAPKNVTPIFLNLSTGLQQTRVWLGLQYSSPIGNVHKNYNFAEMVNTFNLMEIEKMMLEANLVNPNLFVHRGQRVPVLLFNYGDALDSLTTTDPKYRMTERTLSVLNTFLSDFYYVKGHKIIYDPLQQAGFSQVIYLSKREWINSSTRQVTET